MNVLMLCQRVPWPPDRGDRITTWHFLRHLLAIGATVRIGTLAESAEDRAAAARLPGIGAELGLPGRVAEVVAPVFSRKAAKPLSLRGLLSGEALTLPFFRTAALRDGVRRMVAAAPPDLVYVYSSSMAQYALPPLLPGWPGASPPVRVMQFAELDSDKWRQFAAASRSALGRWVYRREAARLLAFEDRVARTFEVPMVVSDVERELFMERIPGVEPVVVPNGVDVEHFRSAGEDRREPHTAVFTGVMDYEPNVDGVLWFAREGWPLVRARFPDARLLIVGNRPCPEIRALDGIDGIEVTGRVPEIPPWLDRAAVAVAPLRLARGVQNKVLEAMSMGLPVVSTPQAAQGIGGGDRPLRVVEDARACGAAVADLFGDAAAARRLGERAAAHVREHYRWSVMHQRFQDAWQPLVDARAGANGS